MTSQELLQTLATYYEKYAIDPCADGDYKTNPEPKA
jgi:hypothetical protein